jgi:hypothetical protein
MASCQQPSQKQLEDETTETMTQDSFRIMAVETMADYDNFTGISLLLRNVDVPYYPELINSIENIERYLKNDLINAANIGVYIVDIAYAYSFEDDNAAAGSYLSAMTLAQSFTGATSLVKNLMANYTVQDLELDTILLKLEQDLQLFIDTVASNEELPLYAALLSGTYIEKIFLLYSTINKYPDHPIPESQQNDNLQRLIWIATGQKKALGELNKIIENYDIPEEHKLCHQQLTGLEKQMDEAVFLRDTSLVHSAGIISSPEFVNLYDEIKKIRGSITEPEE